MLAVSEDEEVSESSHEQCDCVCRYPSFQFPVPKESHSSGQLSLSWGQEPGVIES